MRPDRVAVYSYAHVPWIAANQKRIDPADLPPPDAEARALRSPPASRSWAPGYQPIGMDHFALPGDELARGRRDARPLHRNFMGYTTQPASDMLGAGVSAIGDVGGAFAQNTKKLSTYYATRSTGTASRSSAAIALDADDASAAT